jgi:hypothetical protein
MLVGDLRIDPVADGMARLAPSTRRWRGAPDPLSSARSRAATSPVAAPHLPGLRLGRLLRGEGRRRWQSYAVCALGSVGFGGGVILTGVSKRS